MSPENFTEMSELEEQSFELAQEAQMHRQLADYNCAMFIALEQLSEEAPYKNGKDIAATANLAISTAMEAMGINTFDKKYGTLSLEDIERFKGTFWDKIKKHFKFALTNVVDNIQTFVTLTNFQNSRLQKLKRSLAAVEGNAEVTLSISKNKYMMYGNNKDVDSSETYVQEYVKMCEVMREFCSVASDLNNESKFNVAAYLGAKATFSGDEFVINHFKRLYELVSKVVSTNHLKKEIEQGSSELYASEPLLGMSQVVARLPKKDKVDFDDYKASRDAVRYVYLSMDRIKKVDLNDSSDKIELTFNKQQIQTLIDESESLLKEANKLLAITKKFNTYVDTWMLNSVLKWNTAVAAATVAGSMSYKGEGEGGYPAPLFSAIRVVIQYMNLTFDCTASGYNSSVGNIKKALSIAESFVKKAD